MKETSDSKVIVYAQYYLIPVDVNEHDEISGLTHRWTYDWSTNVNGYYEK